MSIQFIDSVKGIQDGATNNVVTKMIGIRAAKAKADEKAQSIDGALTGIKSLETSGFDLPGIPSINDIAAGMGAVNSKASGTLDTLDDVSGLVGGCLDGAVGSISSIVGDATGLMGDALSALEGFLSPEISRLQGIMGIYQEFLKSLGIDKLVADLFGSLGCLSDAGVLGEVSSELGGITSSLGLDSSGYVDETTYYGQMKQKMTDAGLSTSYADSLSSATTAMSTQSASIAESAKVAAKSKLTATRSVIEKTPSPSTVW